MGEGRDHGWDTARPLHGACEGWNEAFIKDPNGIWIELLQRKK